MVVIVVAVAPVAVPVPRVGGGRGRGGGGGGGRGGGRGQGDGGGEGREEGGQPCQGFGGHENSFRGSAAIAAHSHGPRLNALCNRVLTDCNHTVTARGFGNPLAMSFTKTNNGHVPVVNRTGKGRP
ncbi:hypothetical protein D5H75_08370 [Bailinhaonella thermotolerans]|uniref:Uncharacterized protein n=1 Tax=Bailinhaonella thermotolerans TaxID=1070861 RepID=A0A3A4B9N5_9ACTN|nr:hypothetical protein D5H75_08370 [Bailinhaonella thermotolerans]